MKNIFDSIPDDFDEEIFESLLQRNGVRIERILSKGQSSPEGFWYDQDENEWVLILKGAAVLSFEDGKDIRLNPGDSLDIPAHKKHRVSWTAPGEVTLWLAVFFPPNG